MNRIIMHRKITISILSILIFIIASGFIKNNKGIGTPNQNSEVPRVYYTIYKLVTLSENKPKSEDSYQTFMVPGGVSMEVKDKIRHAKMKSIMSDKTNVRTTTYKLNLGDRVIIYKIDFYDYDHKKYTKIYSNRVKLSSENYFTESSWFIKTRLSQSFIEEYYTGHFEVLYDGVPFYIEEKETSVVVDMMSWMYEFVNELSDDEKEKLKTEEKKVNKATGIGVRG